MKPRRLIEYNGRSQSLTQWAAELGIHYDTLYTRLRQGWPVERALTEPVEIHVKGGDDHLFHSKGTGRGKWRGKSEQVISPTSYAEKLRACRRPQSQERHRVMARRYYHLRKRLSPEEQTRRFAEALAEIRRVVWLLSLREEVK